MTIKANNFYSEKYATDIINCKNFRTLTRIQKEIFVIWKGNVLECQDSLFTKSFSFYKKNKVQKIQKAIIKLRRIFYFITFYINLLKH